MGIWSSNDSDNAIAAGVKPIIIDTETWNRDSHGLFDYETTDVVFKSLRIPTTNKVKQSNYSSFSPSNESYTFSTNLMRDGWDVFLEAPTDSQKVAGSHTADHIENQDSNKNLIAHILYTEGQYWIYSKPYYNKSDDFITNPENLVWYTVRDYRNSASSLGYKLKKGDILKFGRARLRIVEINLEETVELPGAKHYDHKETIDSYPQGFFSTDMEHSEVQTCRICFNETEDENPLICPWKWSGSLKYIHYRCLKNWLESKRMIKHTDTTISYHWKTLEWELCKTIYPELVKTKYCIVSYAKPEKNYMIMESISSSSAKSIYVVNLDARMELFKVGRGHDSDIRVSDISVSRFHAVIVKTEDNELVIKDNNSKFGTLVCLQHPLMLSEFDSIHLQAGRTLMEIQMKERKECTIKNWLWVRQNNEAEPAIRTKNYLGKFGYTDAFLPDEFKKYWNEYSYNLKFEKIFSEEADRVSIEKEDIEPAEHMMRSDCHIIEDDIIMTETYK